jgi:hypothetical protein
MSNPRYHCIIPGCKDKTAHQHFVNHLLKHSSQELQKHLIWSSKASPFVIPKINNMRSDNKASICFGCKKVIKRVALQVSHKEECLCKEAHLKMCKSIFDGTKDKDPSEPEEPEAPESEERAALSYLIEEFPKCKELLEINFPELYSSLVHS